MWLLSSVIIKSSNWKLPLIISRYDGVKRDSFWRWQAGYFLGNVERHWKFEVDEWWRFKGGVMSEGIFNFILSSKRLNQISVLDVEQSLKSIKWIWNVLIEHGKKKGQRWPSLWFGILLGSTLSLLSHCCSIVCAST